MWLVWPCRQNDPRHRVSLVCNLRVMPANSVVRINCRIPQTPRTPTAAAGHYFDDVFSRPNATKPRIRRSSTTRSIGEQSSFNVSASGDSYREDDEAQSAIGSVRNEQHERERRKSEANEHLAKYVADQLERIQSNESVLDEDEFEAQLE